MKNKIKVILPLLFSAVLLWSLIGCSGGISRDEAKEHINSFLTAIQAENYDQAAALLHPERPADLKAYFEKLETEQNLDFHSSLEIEKYTGFSSAYHDSTVNGSTYSLSMKVKAGDKTVRMKIELVRNDSGYGIYNLDITP